MRAAFARVVALAFVSLIVPLVLPAAASANIPTKCAVSADISNLASGAVVTGAGFGARQHFTIYLKPQVVAKPVTDAAGRFTVRVPVPAQPQPGGTKTLQIEGAGCAVELTFAAPVQQTRTDLAAPPAPPPAVAPRAMAGLSGILFSARTSMWIIGGLVALGIACFVVVSRAGHRQA